MKTEYEQKYPDAFILDKEEQAIEDSLGDYEPVPDLEKEIVSLQQIARNTDAKTKSINIRLSQKDLIHIQAAAMREGLSYQTFITSVLHKAVMQ